MTDIKPKVTLHWLNESRAQRIVWLLEECAVDYEIKVYKRRDDMLAPDELGKIHPLGKSPVISVTSANKPEGQVIAESGLITEYLCDHFAPHLVPRRYQEGKEGQVGGETEQWMRFRYYMHYSEASLMGNLLLSLIFTQIKNAKQPFFVKPISRGIADRVDNMYLKKNLKMHSEMLEEQLKTSPEGGRYLCGKDLTAADILMSFPLIVGKERFDTSAYPKLTEYTKLLESNEVYGRSIKKVEEAMANQKASS